MLLELEKLRGNYEEELESLKEKDAQLLSESQRRVEAAARQQDEADARFKQLSQECDQKEREITELAGQIAHWRSQAERLERRVEEQRRGSLSHRPASLYDYDTGDHLEAGTRGERMKADLDFALNEAREKSKEIERLNRLHATHQAEWKSLFWSQKKTAEDLTKQTVGFFSSSSSCGQPPPNFKLLFCVLGNQVELQGDLERERTGRERFERELRDLQRKHEICVADLALLSGNPLVSKRARQDRPMTTSTKSVQTELSIVQEGGRGIVIDESQHHHQTELVEMKNAHYERQLLEISEDNTRLMQLLREQAEIMRQMKAMVVSVGVVGNTTKDGLTTFEAKLRDKVQIEMILRDQIEGSRDKMERFEHLVEERDAWKASTRQLEASVFELAKRNQRLETAFNEIESESESSRQLHLEPHQHTPGETTLDVKPEEEETMLHTWKEEVDRRRGSSTMPSSTQSSRPPSPFHPMAPASAAELPQQQQQPANPIASMKRLLQEQHDQPQQHQQLLQPAPGDTRKGLFLDFSRTGCPKCHKDLVLIV